MKIVADIHLHSYYSRATSKTLNLEHLYKWAQLKGVHVVGTGDIAHPGWLAEMREKLEPAEDGLFRLKAAFASAIADEIFPTCRNEVRFMLAGEISNIYKKKDKVRKIHNVVFLPSFDAVENFQAQLDQIGNIRSDGRPILGLDARDLLEIVLETDPMGYLIPAHIWTPWFSLLGSMSGFDSVEECFDDLTPHIFAVETGLSSDPPMNWRLSQLDRYTLVSNSDAHSPQKLAREANLFDIELSYAAIFDAIKGGSQEEFLGTIEFFPEEGKYHYDGHRKCGIRWDPKQTLSNNNHCRVCGKPVTVGVMHRVEALADRELDEAPESRPPFFSLIPLPEILAEIHNVGVNTKRVTGAYQFLLKHLGSELAILQEVPLDALEKLGGSLLSEGIRRMRAGEVQIAAGFDGEFGTIKLFDATERQGFSRQLIFFEDQVKTDALPPAAAEPSVRPARTAPSIPKLQKTSETSTTSQAQSRADTPVVADPTLASLNLEQREAVTSAATHLLIAAGPGTGKTRTLTHRIGYLLTHSGVAPEQVLALTFTNKAAEEMASRLQALVGNPVCHRLTIRTFHALCSEIVSEHAALLGFDTSPQICSDRARLQQLKEAIPRLTTSEGSTLLEAFSFVKNHLYTDDAWTRVDTTYRVQHPVKGALKQYQAKLKSKGLVDFDDLISLSVELFRRSPDVADHYRTRFRWLLVDEYQDINYAQYQLLRLLTTQGTRLFAIGDPNQAIYGFRGADRKYFLQFETDFTDARVVRLRQNYRSAQTILSASNQVIGKSPTRWPIDTWSENKTPVKLTVYQAPTDKAEAEYVVHEIERIVGGTSYFSMDSNRVSETEYARPTFTFGDFAILCRLREQQRVLGEAFQRSGIPVQIAGEKMFWDDPDVQKLLAVLTFISQPNDDAALEALLLQSKRGIGPATLRQLRQAAADDATSLWERISQSAQRTLAEAQRRSLKEISQALKRLLQSCKGKRVSDILNDVLLQFFNGEFGEIARDTNEHVKRFFLRAKLFDSSLSGFLHHAETRDATDSMSFKADKVTLMTLHASKGMEFPVVFITGCEETLIPFCNDKKPMDLEEERRLIFVGMTRAMEKLYLTNAKSRILFGKAASNKPSRFIDDIAHALKAAETRTFARQKDTPRDDPQLKLF